MPHVGYFYFSGVEKKSTYQIKQCLAPGLQQSNGDILRKLAKFFLLYKGKFLTFPTRHFSNPSRVMDTIYATQSAAGQQNLVVFIKKITN